MCSIPRVAGFSVRLGDAMRTEIPLTMILKKGIVSLCGDQALTNLPWVYAHDYNGDNFWKSYY